LSAAPIRASYTKYEFRIPMRDGKRLFTAVYEDDASGVEVLVLPHP
jgi:predicted acyl esterase